MIFSDEILMGRDTEYPLTKELRRNLDKLLIAVNQVRTAWNNPMTVTSGYRPGKYNKMAGGAPGSAHITCEAVDFSDSSRTLTNYLLNNTKLLETAGLWMEDPQSTPTWVHLQVRPVASGSRIFKP